MSQITYETIQPLITAAQQDGSTMRVTFRCPVTSHTVEASGYIQAEDTIGSRAKDSAKRSLMWSLRSAVGRAVRQALGYNIAGRMASDAAYGAMSGVGTSSSQSFSEDDRRTAVVRAFESVSSQFVWDAQNNRYISSRAAGEVMTDFMRMLNTAPVTAPYDRGILARMLTEIACADGHVGEGERAFLSSFITPEVGTVESLAQMQRLSPAELGEASQGPSRETMLMLAWALAFTDEALDPNEAVRLGEYASGLGLSGARGHELRAYAQVYLVDQALGGVYASGQRDPQAHAEVMAMATRIGMDPGDAERADIRFRKRYGLV